MRASDGQTSFAIATNSTVFFLRSTIGSKGNMSGLRAAEVPLDSDSEADSGATVPGRGQVLVAAEPPQVHMVWEQGIFRGASEAVRRLTTALASAWGSVRRQPKAVMSAASLAALGNTPS